ncbi:hypothetical protein CNY67_07900 [Desulfovibrio sp. G11]|nr:hypothetical protein CNY67_07900 [Desulfovibrio sp. G11]
MPLAPADTDSPQCTRLFFSNLCKKVKAGKAGGVFFYSKNLPCRIAQTRQGRFFLLFSRLLLCYLDKNSPGESK